MKNLKNMFAWITLAVILAVGTAGANANTGVIITGAPQCTDNSGVVDAITGVIITGAPQLAGIIIIGRSCRAANGLIITD